MKKSEIDFMEKLESGEPRFRELASGAVYDYSIGRIVAREITSEQGRNIANKRWDAYKDAAASAVLKEARAIDPNITTEQQAWGFGVAKQWVTLLDSEKPRGDDLVKIGQAMGAMPNALDAKATSPELPQLPNGTGDDVVLLVMRRRMLAGDVVDGEIAEDEND